MNRPQGTGMQAKSVYGQGTGSAGVTKPVRNKPQVSKPERNKPVTAKRKPKSIAAKKKDPTEGVKDKGGSIGTKGRTKRTSSVLTQRVVSKEAGMATTPQAEYR